MQYKRLMGSQRGNGEAIIAPSVADTTSTLNLRPPQPGDGAKFARVFRGNATCAAAFDSPSKL